MSRPELTEILVADPPEAWEALGFTVEDAGTISLGGVRIRLGATPALRMSHLGDDHDLDGLPIAPSDPAPPPRSVEHEIGATGIDHVVVLTPDLERTTSKLRAAGFDHRPSPAPHEFFVIGPCLLELVGRVGEEPRLWGVTLVVEDIDRAAQRPGVKPPKEAVQPGRRIATVQAGLGTALALMTPR